MYLNILCPEIYVFLVLMNSPFPPKNNNLKKYIYIYKAAMHNLKKYIYI